MPIAINGDGDVAKVDTFRANIAEGSGADLPAILGSISMQEEDSVLILRQGKEQVVFPGLGGCKIDWSPGTNFHPMTAAPSGHLVISCDHFANAVAPAATQALSFVTDHTR